MQKTILERVPILTLFNPWAEAVARGLKPTENRTWRPTAGQLQMNDALVIHAGQKTDPAAFEFLRTVLDCVKVADLYARMVPGHVACVVTYRGADTAMATPWDMPQQWHWRLVDPAIPPTRHHLVGQQGLWWVAREQCGPLVEFVEQYINARRGRVNAEA